MATPNPYRQYQTMQVQTAGPAQLTLMCYDGINRFLSQAREAMRDRRYEEQSRHIGKAQALLNELLSGLDFERGGAIARDLRLIYEYCYDRLTQANVNDNVAALEEVQRHVTELREAWAEAMIRAGSAASNPAAARDRQAELAVAA